MIKGIGVDIVDVARFRRVLERSPGVLARTLTERERTLPSGEPRLTESLAARFAAKEAVTKALGGPPRWAWHECEVLPDDNGAPEIHLTGELAALASRRGIDAWHLSLSHDGGQAVAFVVAEGG